MTNLNLHNMILNVHSHRFTSSTVTLLIGLSLQIELKPANLILNLSKYKSLVIFKSNLYFNFRNLCAGSHFDLRRTHKTLCQSLSFFCLSCAFMKLNHKASGYVQISRSSLNIFNSERHVLCLICKPLKLALCSFLQSMLFDAGNVTQKEKLRR